MEGARPRRRRRRGDEDLKKESVDTRTVTIKVSWQKPVWFVIFLQSRDVGPTLPPLLSSFATSHGPPPSSCC
ncbi:conserved hypothetical protein [Ricinus communis]|uniref:Uncharacterized protein n=1 Tax=Ricinus communis TaxID=3988 RepID=B9RKR5_RICCO|nr:conserved hypothetical protein [Ricinus communis]